MKKPSARQDAAALAWKPRLKNATGRTRSLATSGTGHVADEALATIRAIDKLRSRNGDVDDSDVARLAGRCRTRAEAVEPPGRRGGPAAGRPARRGIALPLVGTVAAVVAGMALVAWGGLLSSGRHTVAGKVWLERRPLGSAELHFHPAGPGAEALTVTAADDGRFELTGVPPGGYRVTVRPPAGSTVVSVAANYTAPETTPFQVLVKGDVASLQLRAFRVVPKPRRATWTPGVD